MTMPQPTLYQIARDQLQAVETRFCRLLGEIPESDWDSKPAEGGWTARQQLVHMVQVLEVLPAGIRRASTGGKRSLLGSVPPGLRSWVNGHIIIPLKAKDETRESIAHAYQAANQVLISTLEQLGEEDWAKGMPYPSQYRTVEQMAYRPVEHFEEHEAHLRRVSDLAAYPG
jgi:uncharacterized damage-inducible protein DinB